MTEVPRWGPWAKPLAGGLGDEVPQKLNAFLNLQRRKIIKNESELEK